MTVEQIAKVLYEANRAYCETIGDYSFKPGWENAADWQKDTIIKGVHFHLENPFASESMSHDSWLKEKAATGWKYGPVKDVEKKEHPCFLPYHQLPIEQRVKDYLFKAIVKACLEAV